MIKQGRHKEKFPDVLSRETAIFILTAMVTSNLTQYVMFQTIIYPVLSYFIGPTPIKYNTIRHNQWATTVMQIHKSVTGLSTTMNPLLPSATSLADLYCGLVAQRSAVISLM
jgi:hypothetical protein